MTISKIGDHVQGRIAQTWDLPSWWNLLIVLPWAIGLLLAIQGWRSDRAVAQREKTTWGTITAHEPANHNRYGYSFSLEGKPYTGWEIPQMREPQIGQQVLVYYDPTNPRTNALTDFAELSTRSLGPTPMLLFGIGGVAFLIAYRRSKSPPVSESKT